MHAHIHSRVATTGGFASSTHEKYRTMTECDIPFMTSIYVLFVIHIETGHVRGRRRSKIFWIIEKSVVE